LIPRVEESVIVTPEVVGRIDPGVARQEYDNSEPEDVTVGGATPFGPASEAGEVGAPAETAEGTG
jgi:hypothetical protein